MEGGSAVKVLLVATRVQNLEVFAYRTEEADAATALVATRALNPGDSAKRMVAESDAKTLAAAPRALKPGGCVLHMEAASAAAARVVPRVPKLGGSALHTEVVSAA
jgi:hypothetical protein